MRGVYYPEIHGESWLPIRMILTANYNTAHWNHLHVEPHPKMTGTPPEDNPGFQPNLVPIIAAVREYFPETRMGVYNRRYIGGTTTWSQHSWSNAVDIYAEKAMQQVIYAMLISPTKPEGGDELATLSEEAQEFFEAMFRDVEANLSPPTSPSALRYIVQHLRNHPDGDQRSAAEIRKIISDAIENG